MNRRNFLIASGIASLAFPQLSFAQQYPSKPIHLVVPFPAGSATDTVARIIAEPLGRALGQSMIVENRPGADGIIAVRHIIGSPPDGHRLLMATATSITGVTTLSRNPPYDPVADLTGLTQIGNFPFLLVVNASLPINSIPQLVAYAKANPGKMTYASGNATGIVAMSQLISLTGINPLHVPYKGEPPAMLDLVGGRVDMMFATPTTAGGFINEGKIRPLVTTNKTRLPKAPEVPTMAEAGLAELSFAPWGGVFGPAGMPAPIAERISREIAEVMRQPQVAEALRQQQLDVQTSTPQEFQAFIKRELEFWRKVVHEQKLLRD